MGWFDSLKTPKIKNAKKREGSSTPSGLWKKCSHCGEILQTSKLELNWDVCPYCDHHFRLSSARRIELLVDQGTFKSFGDSLCSNDPLEFTDQKKYCDRLKVSKEKTGMRDSSVCGLGKIGGHQASLALMEFSFMGGSMGVVTGEKIALAMEMGLEKKIPVIVVSCSGGARMQEGILSLMQMGKTSAVRRKLLDQGIPYISILTDPTTGGCAASFAMQGDLILAEPNALIGFAGPRVIEQSIRQSLPNGFQRSEFLQKCGFVDRIVHRNNLKEELTFMLNIFGEGRKLRPQQKA